MDQKRLNETLAAHKAWLEGKPEGRRADLRGASLQEASLQEADIRGSDIDFACWPLWCGSLAVRVDARIAAQLAYHFCRLDCDDPDYIAARNAIIDFANTFHRVEECGKLESRRSANERIVP